MKGMGVDGTPRANGLFCHTCGWSKDVGLRESKASMQKEEIIAMRKEEITALFDKQASSYDQQWSKLAPINAALHLLTSTVLSHLPPTANILCVGAGTGAEILALAQTFPEWHFTAVEPSPAMLDVFRRRAEEQGISSRCVFHLGYLDSLPSNGSFDAATAFLVSQFILERHARSQFFQSIAERLCPEGVLVSSDLAGDLIATEYLELLGLWFRVMSGSGTPAPPEGIERMREAYRRDVAILPPRDVRDIITRGSFDSPVLFFQAGMIHAWYAKRSPRQADTA
jgi:tRNA (cmo5U34)-methyltransferase